MACCVAASALFTSMALEQPGAKQTTGRLSDDFKGRLFTYVTHFFRCHSYAIARNRAGTNHLRFPATPPAPHSIAKTIVFHIVRDKTTQPVAWVQLNTFLELGTLCV